MSEDARLSSSSPAPDTRDPQLSPASPLPVVMAVGGFDPSAGAGVLADIKTIAAMGCYGVAAVTSLTVQNTVGVYGAYHQTAESVGSQMQVLLDDFDIRAVKTGMLPSIEIIGEVARRLRAAIPRAVVVDPVFRSSTGFDLATSGLQAMVDYLFPLATLVTPNIAEAQLITGIAINDPEAMGRSAMRILELGPAAVLLKGGDLKLPGIALDVLVDRNGLVEIAGLRLESRNTHGTGCTLASAIAAQLARASDLETAVRTAKSYVAEAIRTAPGLGKGFGPLNHFEKCLS